MLFNSFEFAIFFPIVLILYWLLSKRWQNVLLLAASYIFYGYWDYRFLSLIFISTFVDYLSAINIFDLRENGEFRKSKYWMFLSAFANLGLLGFFKYYNFFAESLVSLFSSLGISSNINTLNVILPVGISFYTFQTMSYTLDVYRGKISPTRNLLDFALYVCFFPQLVAGPIERAGALLPAVSNKRRFDSSQFIDGIHLIFWGLFKKVFIADNIAHIVNDLFALPNPTAADVAFAGFGYAVQIYCDFSGYSDIARGCSKCLGIELCLNFNFPYIARNPSEFWKRWHISLSAWLRDYLYVPLGGNRKGPLKTYRNLMLTMILGGLWHGAGWVFVLWGAYQGLLLCVHRFWSQCAIAKVNVGNQKSLISNVFQIVMMFQFTCLGWLIFRAESVGQLKAFIISLWGLNFGISVPGTLKIVLFGALLFSLEYIVVFVCKQDINKIFKFPIYTNAMIYAMLFYLFVFYGSSAKSFIYFQF